MRSIYIDASGQHHHALPESIAAGFGALGNEGLARYAVKNMDYVWAAESSVGLSLHLRPSRISPSALAALLYYISDTNPARVVLSYFAGSWCSELLRGRDAAIGRVAELVEEAGVAQSNSILAEDVTLPGDDDSRLQSLARLWKPNVSWREFAEFMATASERSKERYVLFEHDHAKSTFVIRDFGAGIPDWGKDYLASARGRSIEDLPDHDFRRFCAQRYQKAVQSLVPRLEKIDARIYWPRHGTRRSTFWRLTLPLVDPAGRMWLLSTTAADARIDLRRYVA